MRLIVTKNEYKQNFEDDLERAKDAIRNALNEIREKEIHRVYKKFKYRIEVCTEIS